MALFFLYTPEFLECGSGYGILNDLRRNKTFGIKR